MNKFKFYDKGNCIYKLSALLVLIALLLCPYPLYAANNIRQTINNMADRFLLKADLSPKKVILLIEKSQTKTRTKLDNITSEALQSAITSRATLANREMVAEAKKEIRLNQEYGQYRFAGTPVGRMKAVDYFVWAEIETVGAGRATIKLSLLNTKTQIVESYTAEDIELGPTSLAPADLNWGLYEKWLHEKQAANELRQNGKLATAIFMITYYTAEAYANCTVNEMQTYTSEKACSRAEHPYTYTINQMAGVATGVAFVVWMMGIMDESDVEEYRIEQNWPVVTFQSTPNKQTLLWIWDF